MKLREIMTSNPITLTPQQTVQEAAKIFLKHQVDGAPVIDNNGDIIGLFTKNQIYQLVSQGFNILTPVGQLMGLEVSIGHPDDEVDSNLIQDLGWLPIVEHNQVIGMITRTDLLSVFMDFYRGISCELDTIINAIYDLIVSVDEEGNIKVFNQSAERFLGLTAKDVKGKNINELFPNSGMMDVIQTGKEEHMQKIMLNNHCFISNISPIKMKDKIIGAVAVFQHFSELERVSRELKYVKELNQELDAIIESSFDGLYITNGDGFTLRVNKAYERITGVDSSVFLGRHINDIIKEGIVSESVTALVLEHKEPVTIIQQNKSGKTTLATGNPVFDRNGAIFRVVCNVRDITELNMLKQELEQARGLSLHYEKQLRTLRYAGSEKMVVHSAKMKDLMGLIMRLAKVDSTILITGESGTGKELIAETLHKNSARNDGPFIKVNCGAIPENLLESELFGYDYGAFTGAKKQGKAGYFELAMGGTLFLDEIGDLPLNLQVKLLRVLQSREIVRVGGEKPLKIDARILAGTNRNLLEMVQNKEFREDLYYRLNVVPVNVPPLRERKEDIPALITHFVLMFNLKYKLNKRISQDMIDVLMRYDWPGNVRELENLIERLVVVTSRDILTKDDLPSNLGGGNLESLNVQVSGLMPLKDAVESVERQVLERAYAECRTTRQMAKVLKVDASTIVRKAAKYGISKAL
ncbi:sigma 54-interacting transcriptional regulator [Desulfotomaculum defluvii]